MKNSPSVIKIISGHFRGRNVPIISAEGLRPSPIRIRETVFNWLQFEIEGAVILDAFAGSGAMGLEAISRGAQSVLFTDKNSQAIASIKNILQDWKISHARCQTTDALRIQPSQVQYDYIFLDPPFHLNLQQSCLDQFLNTKFLKPQGKIYIELPFPLSQLELPKHAKWLKQSKAGKVHFGLIGFNHE